MKIIELEDMEDKEPSEKSANSSQEFDQSVMLSDISGEKRDKITYGELSDILENLHINYDEASCITVQRGHGKHALHHQEHENLVDVRSFTSAKSAAKSLMKSIRNRDATSRDGSASHGSRKTPTQRSKQS